jgi:hypothetical protein
MNRKLRWVTETAVMLALLVSLQAITKPMGQLVTGSCVNAVLAVSVLVGGMGCGVTVALISPVMAFLLGIAPQILTVPAIMAGNAAFVVALRKFSGDKAGKPVRKAAALLTAAVCKFSVLHVLVVNLICGVLSERLLASGAMKPPMLTALPATFSWPQLITALIGGGVALAVVPLVKKALSR